MVSAPQSCMSAARFQKVAYFLLAPLETFRAWRREQHGLVGLDWSNSRPWGLSRPFYYCQDLLQNEGTNGSAKIYRPTD
jgi:hypothetical protein